MLCPDELLACVCLLYATVEVQKCLYVSVVIKYLLCPPRVSHECRRWRYPPAYLMYDHGRLKYILLWCSLSIVHILYAYIILLRTSVYNLKGMTKNGSPSSSSYIRMRIILYIFYFCL